MTEQGGSSGSEGSGSGESIDSFLRDVARAPEKLAVDATGRAPTELARKIRLDVGAVVGGRFRLERRLGEGGMGVVWQAVHAVTRKPVALKFLKGSAASDPHAVQRFLREARAACAVQHPCVVSVHDVLELEDGSPMMVMDLLVGETFADRLAREGAQPLPEVARIMVHVCSAVGWAHALGIVHRDLKPENIFLARSLTGATEVKVLDFGIAKLTASEGDAAQSVATTATGSTLGTPHYMAPEQLLGEKDVDHRADIWALGIILYEALAGARPTRGANMLQVYKLVTTGGIPPLSEKTAHLPGPVVDLVSRMLARDRALRPDGVREVLATLSQHTDEAFVAVDAAPVRAASPSEPYREPATDNPGQASVDAAIAIDPPRAAPARWPWLRAAILVGGAAIVVPLTFVAWLYRWTAPAPPSPTIQHSPPLVTDPTQAPGDRTAPSLTAALSVQPSPTPAPLFAPSTEPSAAAPAPPLAATPAGTSPAPQRRRGTPSSAATSKSPTPVTNCEPPTWTDEKGHIHVKQGC
jgi:serine/threonine protein kinase